MRARDLARLRRTLSERLDELARQGLATLRTGRSRAPLDAGEVRDEGDESVRMLQADTELRLTERDLALAQQIEAAIARIDAGRYGVCVDCDEPIEPERLAAVPWALRCVADQEASEIYSGEPRPPTL